MYMNLTKSAKVTIHSWCWNCTWKQTTVLFPIAINYFVHRFPSKYRTEVSPFLLFLTRIVLFKQRRIILGQLSATITRSMPYPGLAGNTDSCQVQCSFVLGVVKSWRFHDFQFVKFACLNYSSFV